MAEHVIALALAAISGGIMASMIMGFTVCWGGFNG